MGLKSNKKQYFYLLKNSITTFGLILFLLISMPCYANAEQDNLEIQFMLMSPDKNKAYPYFADEIDDSILLRRINPSAGLENMDKNPFQLMEYRVVAIGGSLMSGLRSIGNDNNGVTIETAPLFYPSPFKITEGSTLYVKVNKDSAGEIEFRVYDILGNEIYRSESKYVGQNNYNVTTFKFGEQQLGHRNLPAGIYFYLVIKDGEVLKNSEGQTLGKGKFAILP